MMRLRRFLIVAAVCCCGAAYGQTGGDGRQVSDQEEAKRLWDRIVDAKGGREKLQAVNNVLIVWRPRKKYPVTLFSFPNKMWEWEKDIYDEEPMVTLDSGSSGVYKIIKLDGKEILGESSLLRISVEPIPYLLETRLLQPIPVSVSRRRFGKETLDVVRTEMKWYENKWVDFAVEPDSLMVRLISFWDKTPGYSPNPYRIMCFSEYTEVDGIKIAQKFMDLYLFPPGVDVFDLKKCRYRSVIVRVDVQHREDLFISPPPVADGPEAWKPKPTAQLKKQER